MPYDFIKTHSPGIVPQIYTLSIVNIIVILQGLIDLPHPRLHVDYPIVMAYVGPS